MEKDKARSLAVTGVGGVGGSGLGRFILQGAGSPYLLPSVGSREQQILLQALCG